MASTEATILVHNDGHTFSLPIAAFQGLPSTLCKGCGHNSITSYLIDACKAVGVNPYTTVKFSGIGCSSKTPAYFLQSSHGFNAPPGRPPPAAPARAGRGDRPPGPAARLFPPVGPRLQRAPRAHAVGGDRRLGGQSPPAQHR